jgi:hypothetical protein
MNGKFGWLTLIAVGIIILAAVHFSTTAQAQQGATPAFTTSRYAMMTGQVLVRPELRGGEQRTEHGVFKLDTYTGNAWMLDVKANEDGTRSAVWVPVGGSK